MPRVSFADYLYYPEITSSWAEKSGFTNLEAGDKDKVLLTFLLGQVDNNSSNLDPAVRNLQECVEDRPFIIDLLKHPAPNAYEPKAGFADAKTRERYDREVAVKTEYDSILNGLLDPTDGFSSWRRFVEQWNNAIPVLQFSKPKLQARNILRQAIKFAADKRSFAIRLTKTDAPDLISIISNIFAVVDRPHHVLFILDMGQARTQVVERESFVTETMAQIMALVGERDRSRLRFVCTGGSFTKSTPNGLHSRDIHEREIWSNIAEGSSIRYGDYSSMLRLISSTTFRPADYRAAVTLPMHTSWWCWRSADANNSAEWEAGAKEIRDHEDFDTAPECWGKAMIRRAAGGDTADIQSNRHWIAARINLHLKRQIDYSDELGELSDEI